MTLPLPSSVPDYSTALLRSGKVRLDMSTAKLSANEGSKLDKTTLSRINDAAKDFEAVFLGEMIKPMFDTVGTDSMFGGGTGEDAFRDQLTQQYGKQMANAGGIGLASYIRDAMIQRQEGALK